MAVELKEGGYALHQGRSRKTVIQVKLTDSALRAIESYEENMQVICLIIIAISLFQRYKL